MKCDSIEKRLSYRLLNITAYRLPGYCRWRHSDVFDKQ